MRYGKDVRVIHLLSQYGIDIKGYKNPTNSNTPLHEAVFYNNMLMSSLMINSGLFIGDVNDNFITPLMIAIENNEFTLVASLLHNDANPNRISANGWTPFLLVVSLNRINFAKLMLQIGADIRITRNGKNAIDHAYGELKDYLNLRLKGDLVDSTYVKNYINSKISPDVIYMDEGPCKMCMCDNACMVSVPCGHVSFCKDCCYQYDICGICNVDIKKFIEIKR